MRNALVSRLAMLVMSMMTLALISCDVFEDTDASQVTVNYDLRDFDEVELGGAMDIELVRGADFAITVEGRADDVDNLELKVRNGKLISTFKPNSRIKGKMVLTVKLPTLLAASLGGNTDTEIRGIQAGGQDIDLFVSGNSRVMGSFDARNMHISISGDSDLELSGTAADVDLQISGNSDFQAASLTGETWMVDISGQSQAEINALSRIRGSLSGQSTLRYRGNPTEVNVSTSGNSKVVHL